MAEPSWWVCWYFRESLKHRPGLLAGRTWKGVETFPLLVAQFVLPVVICPLAISEDILYKKRPLGEGELETPVWEGTSCKTPALPRPASLHALLCSTFWCIRPPWMQLPPQHGLRSTPEFSQAHPIPGQDSRRLKEKLPPFPHP